MRVLAKEKHNTVVPDSRFPLDPTCRYLQEASQKPAEIQHTSAVMNAINELCSVNLVFQVVRHGAHCGCVLRNRKRSKPSVLTLASAACGRADTLNVCRTSAV